MKDEILTTFPCDACGQLIEDRPHKHHYRRIATYGIVVCPSCYAGNSDGWTPHLAEKIIAKAEENGLPLPKRNANGLLPRD